MKTVEIYPKHEKYTPPTHLKPKQKTWSQYCPDCTLEKKSACHPCQSQNIKKNNLYQRIEIGGNQWMTLAATIAKESAQNKGGPFGAVIVQIDDKTREVLRYWCDNNHVTEWNDPTAHAEVSVIRVAAKHLGVFNLGHIKKEEAQLPQDGDVSHCEIYSSTEPCPMCHAAIYWTRMPILYFAATRFDAAEPGVDFSDEIFYSELSLPYHERKYMKVYQSSVPNSLDAFNWWKRSADKIQY